MVYCGDAMKNFYLSLTSRADFDNKIDRMLSENPSQSWYAHITKNEKKEVRGLPANAQQHVWYDQIANYREDETKHTIKNLCKYMFGLQIALASPKLQPMVSFLIDKLEYNKYSYESKVKLMSAIVRTSDFSAKESKKYMDEMVRYWSENGAPIKYQDS